MTVILVLVIVGLGLLAAEAHLPTHGVLGTVGIGALLAGIVLAAIESGGALALAVGLALGLPIAAAFTAFTVVAVRKARVAGRLPARCGAEGLVGHVGVVRRPLDPLGQVAIDGELWRASRSWAEEDEPPLGVGEAVVVDRVQGLTLSVRKAEAWEVEP
jgi:membrane-bound serine protease (ClpP class)